MATRQLSDAAKAAKLIRTTLKKAGLKATVRSKNFSMGNSVTVKMTDQPPATMKAIERELSQYRAGSFDGMEDLYAYDNRRDDIPQTKFLSIRNDFSAELKQAGYEYLRTYHHSFEDLPDDYESAQKEYNHDRVCFIEMTIRQLLAGSLDFGPGFWTLRKPRVRLQA